MSSLTNTLLDLFILSKDIFFVWTPEEIRSVLGGSASGLLIVSKTRNDSNDAQLFMDAYGVTAKEILRARPF